MHIKVCILTWWMELSNLVISVDTLDISHDVFHLGTFSLYCSAFWWNNVDNAEKIKNKICIVLYKNFQVTTHYCCCCENCFQTQSVSTNDHKNYFSLTLKSNFALIWHWEMKSSYFQPTFEFWNWDSAYKRLLKWSHLNSRRFNNP